MQGAPQFPRAGVLPNNQLPTYANILRDPNGLAQRSSVNRYTAPAGANLFNAPEGQAALLPGYARLRYANINGNQVLLPRDMEGAPGDSVQLGLQDWRNQRLAENLANRPPKEEMARRREDYQSRAEGRKNSLLQGRDIYNAQKLAQQGLPIPGRLQESLNDFRRQQQEMDYKSKAGYAEPGGNRQQGALWSSLLGSDPGTAAAIMQNPQLQQSLLGQLGITGQRPGTNGPGPSNQEAIVAQVKSDLYGPDGNEVTPITIPQISENNSRTADSLFKQLMTGKFSEQEIMSIAEESDANSPPAARNTVARLRELMADRERKMKDFVSRDAERRNNQNDPVKGPGGVRRFGL